MWWHFECDIVIILVFGIRSLEYSVVKRKFHHDWWRQKVGHLYDFQSGWVWLIFIHTLPFGRRKSRYIVFCLNDTRAERNCIHRICAYLYYARCIRYKMHKIGACWQTNRATSIANGMHSTPTNVLRVYVDSGSPHSCNISSVFKCYSTDIPATPFSFCPICGPPLCHTNVGCI